MTSHPPELLQSLTRIDATVVYLIWLLGMIAAVAWLFYITRKRGL